MRSLHLRTIGVLSLTVLTVFSLIAPASSYAQSVPYQQVADQVLDKYTNRVADKSDAQVRITTIENKINSYLTTNLSAPVRITLKYIQQELATFKDDLDEPTVVAPETEQDEEQDTSSKQDQQETQEPRQETTTTEISRYFEGNKTIVAGEESPPVMQLSYTARLEDVLIEDIAISSSANLGELFSSISIYTSTGKLHSSRNVAGSNITLNGVDLYIPQDTTDFYLTLTPHPIGNEHLGDQLQTITLTVSPTTARGQITNDEISTYGRSHSSDSITIAPVRIAAIDLVKSAYGRNVDSRLYNGTIDMAILKLTADERDNTRSTNAKELALLLDTISVRLEDGTTAQNLSSNLELERIDTNAGSPISGSGSGDRVVFDLTTTSTSVHSLDPGETAYFLVRGHVTLDQTTQESAKVIFDKLNTGGIIYKSDDPSALPIRALNLNQSLIEGPSLVE